MDHFKIPFDSSRRLCDMPASFARFDGASDLLLFP
jgi:hypothetical protein